MITLRPVIASDLPVLFEFQREPEGNAMAAFPPRDREAFDAHWAKIMAVPANILRTIVDGSEVVGSIGSWPSDGRRLLGYWIGKQHWGKGSATAALAALLRELPARPLHAFVAKHNLGSIRVLEKCGFTLEKEQPEAMPEDGIEEWLYRLD